MAAQVLNGMLSTAVRARRAAARIASDYLSDVTTLLGRPPLIQRSIYSAIEQWAHAVEGMPYRERPQRIGLYVLRNAYWMEFICYSAFRLRTMGHVPMVLYSGRELACHWQGKRWPGAGKRELFARLRRQGVLELVDIDGMLDDPVEAQGSAGTGPGDTLSPKSFEALAAVARAYDTRTAVRSDAVTDLADELAQCARATQRASELLRLERAVVPSGLIGMSGAVLRGLRERGIPVITVESWGLQADHMVWNLNRPAVRFDMTGWLEHLSDLDTAQQYVVHSYMAYQDHPRDRGASWSGYRNAQRHGIEDELPRPVETLRSSGRPLALLGTNIVGDSATLGRETVFPDQLGWIRETVSWFHDHPQYGLIIRVHPEEGIHQQFVSIASDVKRIAEGAPNVVVIEPNSPVNTFALARHVRVGLPWVSNVGVDLIARGVPVVLAAAAPYSGLGMADEPATRAQYFRQVEEALTGRRKVSDEERLLAHRYLYVITRLVSLPGNPLRRDSHYPRLPPAANDPYHLFFRVLCGDADRSDCLRAAKLADHARFSASTSAHPSPPTT